MKFKALLIKFIMITAVLWVVFGFYGASIADIILTSVLVTGVSYIGDLFVLPKFGNVAATIADFGLVLVMIWLLGSYMFEPIDRLGTATFLSAIIITAGEFFFHSYMFGQVFDKQELWHEKNKEYYRGNIQTEFGSEIDFKKNLKKKKQK